MINDTADKAVLGLAAAIKDLTIRGYLVSIPLSEHAPFDLIATTGAKSLTIQVKHRRLTGKYGDKISVRFFSSYANPNGYHESPMDKAVIDLVCIYCPESDECYYIDPKKESKSITLHVGEVAGYRNSQTKVRLAKDYLRIPNI